MTEVHLWMQSSPIKCWDELIKGREVGRVLSTGSEQVGIGVWSLFIQAGIYWNYKLLLGGKRDEIHVSLARHMYQTGLPYIMGNLS